MPFCPLTLAPLLPALALSSSKFVPSHTCVSVDNTTGFPGEQNLRLFYLSRGFYMGEWSLELDPNWTTHAGL